LIRLWPAPTACKATPPADTADGDVNVPAPIVTVTGLVRVCDDVVKLAAAVLLLDTVTTRVFPAATGSYE
jgi:hypothetical protein